MTHAILLTADMIRFRDQFKLLLGTRYLESVAAHRAVLSGKAKESGRPLAEVALKLAQELEAKGHDPSLMICALVEECGS